MFEIKINPKSEVILRGRFDASHIAKAKTVFESIRTSAIVNFKELEYISSAGLGVLLLTQKRLTANGDSLKLTEMNNHIKEIF